MTEEESIPAVVERPFAPRTFFATLPVWKKTMIAGAVMMLVAAAVTIFVEVKWQALDDAFTQFGGLFRGQFEKFRTFITGSLPNAALAGLGLFTGFKKNR
jgi:hypothetical protein